jgi:cytochrome oxidase Cu insertion factor (SCO1/SenC/PrrC family)
MQSINEEKRKSNRKLLLVVLFLFVLPALASFALYFTEWRPSSGVNYGELIVPVRLIEDRSMQDIDDKVVNFAALKGKWTMVYFDSAECDDACISQFYFMRQTHASQGKNVDRMQRLFVLTDTNSVTKLKPKLSEYADMLVWKSDKAATVKLMQEFGLDAQPTPNMRSIYLLDPQGNLMMRYAPGAQPAGVRKDLERLLKYSADK